MDKKQVRAWWPRSPHPGNFGDILTPIILDKMYGVQAVFTLPPFREPTLFGVGSIVQRAESNTVIWGSGLIDSGAPVKRDATYLAVRGPRTYEILKSRRVDCPRVFGDPALLLPVVYNQEVEETYEYGIFPHYVDYEMVSKWYQDDESVLVINPLNADACAVIDQVRSCKAIVSSSLHGIICAHAYGIPAVWVKHSDKLSGDDIKFHDYYEAMGMRAVVTQFRQKQPLDDLDYRLRGDINLAGLITTLDSYIGE